MKFCLYIFTSLSFEIIYVKIPLFFLDFYLLNLLSFVFNKVTNKIETKEETKRKIEACKIKAFKRKFQFLNFVWLVVSISTENRLDHESHTSPITCESIQLKEGGRCPTFSIQLHHKKP